LCRSFAVLLIRKLDLEITSLYLFTGQNSPMEPGSTPADHAAQQNSQKLANVIGTLIALLTLAVPLLAIVHFSSGSSGNWQTPGQLSPVSRQ
jgi:hypothetical protein